MIYEVITNSQRLEVVEAETIELALLKANHLCEETECLSYLRERDSGVVIWCWCSLLSLYQTT